MKSERWLIVNADDFGQSPGINQGIIETHQRGIVTSASLMVRWPAAVAAAEYARAHPDFSIGLHLDLAEFAFRDDKWVCLYQVVPLDDPVAVKQEVERQLALFRELVGRAPSHLDSHQHIHRQEPVRAIVQEFARELGIPVRHYNPDIVYCGDFYGQTREAAPMPEAISVQGLLRTLRDLPGGTVELACHPGSGMDIDSMYGAERAEEVRTLCHPSVREAIQAQKIRLRSFHPVSRPAGRPDLEHISQKMKAHYETVWQVGDAWSFEQSDYEQARFAFQIALLEGRHYPRVLEIGCGSGCFTQFLARLADRVVAVDIAAAAIERARQHRNESRGPGVIEWQTADIMHYDFTHQAFWDLVVFSEAVYILGWLYPFFDLAWLATRLFQATRPGGRFLLSNTYGREGKDWLNQPAFIHSYRDLFRNVGYQLDVEKIFQGTKDGIDFTVLCSLFEKPRLQNTD